MIESLFGSKTRVKLLQLFLRNPVSSFYVREITRLIDEQINSVRRELANLMAIDIIQSQNVDNKLYYQVNAKYEHYGALSQLFAADQSVDSKDSVVKDVDTPTTEDIAPVVVDMRINSYKKLFGAIDSLRVVVLSGRLSGRDTGAVDQVDLLLAGTISPQRLSKMIKAIEKLEGIEVNYSLLSFEEFYYRLNIKDRFISDILKDDYIVIEDKDNVLSGK